MSARQQVAALFLLGLCVVAGILLLTRPVPQEDAPRLSEETQPAGTGKAPAKADPSGDPVPSRSEAGSHTEEPVSVVAAAGEETKPLPAEAPKKKAPLHQHEPPPPQPPMLKGWEAPAAAIVITGEQNGYIEPCGCSLNQLGGMSRRADLIRKLQEKGWPVTALDVGGLVNNPTRPQAKLKLGMTLKSLKEMGYAAVALGVSELEIGVELLTFTEDDRPPFVSSNLLLFGTPDIGSHVPYRLVTVGNLKLGVTAVFGKSYSPEIFPGGEPAEGEPSDVRILDPEESLKKALEALEAEKPDLLVLLSHARLEETKELAAKFPQFRLIVSAGGPEDPDPRPKSLGEALLVTPGQKGKNVGIVGIYPDSKDKPLRFEQVALDDQRFKDSPVIQEQMRHYQELLQLQNLVAGGPAVDSPWNAQLKEPNDFVGAKVCGECHTKAYNKWLETGHAKATESLKHGRAGQEAKHINRVFDPECVACHVTGWSTNPKFVTRYKSGYESEQATGHLVGQQCENCHGPGGRHAELERQFPADKSLEAEVEKFRDLAHVALDTAGQNLCVKCHDGDNDPHFKTDGPVFEKYWDEIKHPWRD